MPDIWQNFVVWCAYIVLFLVAFIVVMCVVQPKGPKGVKPQHCAYAWWHEPHEWNDRDGTLYWCAGS